MLKNPAKKVPRFISFRGDENQLISLISKLSADFKIRVFFSKYFTRGNMVFGIMRIMILHAGNLILLRKNYILG